MLHDKTFVKTVVIAVAGILVIAFGAAAQDATYVGNTQCKICHNKKEEGEQWTKWKAQKHASAFQTLSSDEAKAAAQAKGLSKPPAESPECLKCHVTGYDAAAGKAPEKIKPEDGVQCESCHGPASNHTAEAKKFKSGDQTAKPADKIKKGNADTCKQCHNEESPTWKADRYTLADGKKVGFDFEQAHKKIEHGNPLKKK